MKSEVKQCQNCKNDFKIEPEDFQFYEKIKVPAPTFCPECRMIRRMTWRNERTLYKKECSLTKKNVITCFSPESGIFIYDRDAWWSDDWDPFSFGKEYDFNKPFFSQFRELLAKMPMPSLFNNRCHNSDYGNHNGEIKNGYLIFATWQGEDIMYGSQAHGCKNSMDILSSVNSELCYEINSSRKLYRSFFIENSENCNDSYFLYECKGCSNCFGCSNLRSKSYWMFNKPYSKEEYFKKLKEINLGDYKQLNFFKKKFNEIKAGSIKKYANIYNSQNSTGNNLSHVGNCKSCFDFSDARDCRYCINGGLKMYDSYDNYGAGANSELVYESLDTGANGSKLHFDIFVWAGNDVQYSYASHGCSNCFGCIGLRNKEYCILNKQYTKEEYKSLVSKIKNHMIEMPYVDQRGVAYKYGEFFPSEMSPFGYNETIAQEHFPLSKEQIIEKKYKWKEPDVKEYTPTITSSDLLNNIKDVSESIIKEVIGCEHQGKCLHQCTTAFKIIPQELQFYKKMNLPLPRLCPNCRHYERLSQRNPLKLWQRQCQCLGKTSESGIYQNTTTHQHHGEDKCLNEFQTSYSPDRKEIVYCEQCYQQEVV